MVHLLADNITSSLGFTTSENFEALKTGQVGIQIIDDGKLYPEPFPASVVNTDVLDRKFQALNLSVSYTRLEKMMILSITDALKHTHVDIRSARTGIIISTTKGNIDLLERDKAKHFEKERVLLWRLGEIIGNYFSNPNRVEVLSNACISGVVAINTAASLIENGKYDHMVVCGGDIVSKFVVSGFMSFLSLSPTACKPFDIERDGLSLGEAAGTIVLGKNSISKNSICWIGGTTANDANHISGPSRTGEGSFIAIQKSFKEANLDSTNIDHISAHGTATPYNDEMESIAISRHQMESVPVNSLKGNWGHTLGAAGIVETIALAEEMRQNTVIKTLGFSKSGVSKNITIIDKTASKDLKTCLKMASGFGGSNAALILQKTDHNPQPATRNLQPATCNLNLTTCCHIKNNKVYLNGELLFEDKESESLNPFITKAYRHFKPKYAKFFKMDEISKLGFLATEVLLSKTNLQSLKVDEVGVVLSNSQSTLVTDLKFQESIQEADNFFPSPSVFVYTLPNIMIGEISIRHGFRGEHAFFIFDAFNVEFVTDYIDDLFLRGKSRACIGGWVDQSENNYEAFVYLIQNPATESNAVQHTAQNIKEIYNSIG